MAEITKRSLLVLAPVVMMLASCSNAKRLPANNGEAVTSYQDEQIDIGYGTASRKDLGFAVNKVDVDETVVRGYESVAEYIRSRVPGVEVNPNGTVQIRGQKMLTGPAEALIVVDDVICDNINSVNPNQIHSVQVLKDGGSAAIYGSRGGNGVVIITTKMAYETQQAKIAAKKAQKEARKAAKNKNHSE